MAVAPAPIERRRPRPGSLERPINGRMYRGTWLLVALPLLVAAFSVTRPAPLAAPPLPPTFDRTAAGDLATGLARSFPDRSPGSAGASGAAQWFASQLEPYGFKTRTETFYATVPGRGRVRLQNLTAVAQGRSPDTIVVMAHRDNAGTGPGANDNASGTAALIELARGYANPGSALRAQPTHRILFLSTDGGAFGGLGAAHFAADPVDRRNVVAVVNLVALAGTGRPRLEIAGDSSRSPAAALVETAATRVLDQTGSMPTRPSALRQLVDLAFPFSAYEQAPFVARGIPAVTLTTAPDRPPASFGDTPERLNTQRLTQLGRSTQELLSSLDQGLELAQGTSSYVFLGARIIRGWALELVLIAALLPFLAVAVDLFARCRRRRIPLTPAFRSFRSRLVFWLFVGVLFELLGLLGAWPEGAARPPSLESSAATRVAFLPLVVFVLGSALAWLVARERLLPRRHVLPEDELAGYTAAFLGLAVVSLLVVGTNAFALIFVLPSLHAWLWLPQMRDRGAWRRALLVVTGFLGPLLLLWSLGSRYGLGLHAPWYLAVLVSIGYVPLTTVAIVLAWAAAAGQVAALATGRYAPYPEQHERPPLGPTRRLVRRIILGFRKSRRASPRPLRALRD
ncbi:MAG TPA: M28 family peptidase [Gaiellaceae bacterium]